MGFSTSPSKLHTSPNLREDLSTVLRMLLYLIFTSCSTGGIILCLGSPILSVIVFTCVGVGVVLSTVWVGDRMGDIVSM